MWRSWEIIQIMTENLFEAWKSWKMQDGWWLLLKCRIRYGIRTIRVNRTKFAIFVPNSRQLYLILTKLMHELGTHTHWDTLHATELCILCVPCDLNGSVRGRVSSSRTRFWTLPNFNSEVSEPKILLFSYWFFMQIRHRTLPNLNLEVSNSTIFSNISFIPNIWKLN